jgi:hypothetical protein
VPSPLKKALRFRRATRSRFRSPGHLLLSIAVGIGLLVIGGAAYADCASGDGIVPSPGNCTVPQNLTGPTGLVAGSARAGEPGQHLVERAGHAHDQPALQLHEGFVAAFVGVDMMATVRWRTA